MTEAEKSKAIYGECGLSAGVEAIGERWSFLILRGAFNGLSHFEQFQQTLGIARNVLSNRLARLVAHGILVRQPDPADGRKILYRLTDKGKALLPVLVALRQWGERWVAGVPTDPVLVERRSGEPIAPIAVRAADGRPLGLHELGWRDAAELPAAEPAAAPARRPGVSPAYS